MTDITDDRPEPSGLIKPITLKHKQVGSDYFYNPIYVETVDETCHPVVIKFGNEYMQYIRQLSVEDAFALGEALIQAAKDGDIFGELG